VQNPGTGDVVNASDQPLATYNPNDPNSTSDTSGAPPRKAPTWCPSQAGSSCGDLPADFPQGLDLQKNYMANVSTAGQDETLPAIPGVLPGTVVAECDRGADTCPSVCCRVD
jgi:hypothetical protein